MDAESSGDAVGAVIRRPGPFRTTLFVLFVAVLMTAVPGHEFGVRWAVTDALVCLLVIACFVFGRRRHLAALSRSVPGLTLLFGWLTLVYAYFLFSGIAFIVGELAHGSAWDCLALSTGLGALITAVSWQGQLRRFGAVRAQLDKAGS